jgi:hypothetical protein
LKEVLRVQKKKENHLDQTFCQMDLWMPSENSIPMLLGIPTGVIDMVVGKLTKVSHHLDSKNF